MNNNSKEILKGCFNNNGNIRLLLLCKEETEFSNKKKKKKKKITFNLNFHFIPYFKPQLKVEEEVKRCRQNVTISSDSNSFLSFNSS